MAVRHPTFVSEQALTTAEFLAWLGSVPPADPHHYELIGGRIVMTPPAGWPHGTVGAEFLGRLREHVRRSDAGIVLDSSAGYALPTGDVLEPDVSFISRARWEAGPRPAPGEMIGIVPDLVIEVLSSNRKRDLVEKRAIYEAAGVHEYWVVDPEERTVLVHRREGPRLREPERVAEGATARSGVLSGFELAVSDLFDLPT